MTDQNTNQNITPQTPEAPVASTPVQPTTETTPNNPVTQKTKGSQVMDLFKDVFANFKGNKKLFKLTMILLGIIVFIIILGSIFLIIKGMRGSKNQIVEASPSPTPEIILTEESKTNETRLKELKNIILNLDIRQRHLTPPVLRFDLSFE